MPHLSDKARRELESVLRETLDESAMREFDDDLLDDLGARLLSLAAVALKARVERGG